MFESVSFDELQRCRSIPNSKQGEFIWPILSKIFLMGSFYLMGAVFYATKWPEKSFPGKFDYGVSYFWREIFVRMIYDVIMIEFSLKILAVKSCDLAHISHDGCLHTTVELCHSFPPAKKYALPATCK